MKTPTLHLAILCGAVATRTSAAEFDELEHCPGSPAYKHAQCAMVVTFPSNSCEEVAEEILSRMTNPSWIDPHNAGEYTIVQDDNNDGEDIATIASSVIRGERITGDQRYTDKFMMNFIPSGGGNSAMVASGTTTGTATSSSCKVMACSQSQVFSILDFSTNYCNMRNLYCSSKDGCVVEKFDISEYEEEYSECKQNEKDKCIVATSGQ